MKIFVKTKSNSRTPKIIETSKDSLEVWVNAPAIEGLANERLIEILAEHFKKPGSCIKIIKGASSRRKVVEII
ncbi:MAG: hypothetical protein CEN90_775 [Parcubacteria group bacterium Licking1014_17]|nr:MAG: hypothetical protein CEN90_775 [Parcubacteria group bacterium Licking1014_17]